MRETGDDTGYRPPRVRAWARSLPPVSRVIIFTTCGAFLVQYFLDELVFSDPTYRGFLATFGLVPGNFLGRRLWLWQPVTYLFLHATENWLHIIFNMFVFAMFGPDVERAMGPKRFSVLYFGSGIFAAVGSALVLVFTEDAGIPIIGASGAVLGVLAAYGSLFPNRIVKLFFVFPMKAKHCVLLLAGLELLAVFMGNQAGHRSGVATFTHLAGFLAGFLFIRYEWTLHSALLKQVQRHYDRARETDKQLRDKVDQLLEKVNREGINNLTWRERAFLKRASKRFKKQRRK